MAFLSCTFLKQLLQKISNHPLQIAKVDIKEDPKTESGEDSETEGGEDSETEIGEIGLVDDMGIMSEMVSKLQRLVTIDDTETAASSSCKLKFIIELLVCFSTQLL